MRGLLNSGGRKFRIEAVHGWNKKEHVAVARAEALQLLKGFVGRASQNAVDFRIAQEARKENSIFFCHGHGEALEESMQWPKAR